MEAALQLTTQGQGESCGATRRVQTPMMHNVQVESGASDQQSPSIYYHHTPGGRMYATVQRVARCTTLSNVIGEMGTQFHTEDGERHSVSSLALSF
jgi:hypothetical protein